MNRPFSQACANNREPIYKIINRVFSDREKILEVGSGTGQHAAAFAPRMPHLTWQTSDLFENHAGIYQWCEFVDVPNLKAPILLDVNQMPWPTGRVDGIYTANTLHIMSWSSVQNFFSALSTVLSVNGRVVIYGPFNYHGAYTSPSNEQFDYWLKARDPESGIRDFEAVNALAEQAGLLLLEDNDMPANNRLLVWATDG